MLTAFCTSLFIQTEKLSTLLRGTLMSRWLLTSKKYFTLFFFYICVSAQLDGCVSLFLCVCTSVCGGQPFLFLIIVLIHEPLSCCP